MPFPARSFRIPDASVTLECPPFKAITRVEAAFGTCGFRLSFPIATDI